MDIVANSTPETLSFKIGDIIPIDQYDSLPCIGYEISIGNKYNGFEVVPIWWNGSCWMMNHPTDSYQSPISAPKELKISPRFDLSL